jgi:hypothetical protein
LFDRELTATAAPIVAPGNRILAIDESSGTIEKRYGKSDERATAHLNAMNAGGAQLPCLLSLVCGSALRAPGLKAWKGQPGSVAAAQKALFRRANTNGAGRFDRYKAEIKRTRRQSEIAGRMPIKGASKYGAVRLWLGIEKPVIMRQHAGRQAKLSTVNKSSFNILEGV